MSVELLGLYPSMLPTSPVRALGLPLSDLVGMGDVCDGVDVAVSSLPGDGAHLPCREVPEEAFPIRMGALCRWPPPRWR